MPRFKTPYHEAHFKSKLSARKILNELIIEVKFKQGGGKNSSTQSKLLATTRSRNSMPMLGNRTITRGIHTPTQQWKPNNDLRLDEVQECLCIEGGEWVRHRDGRFHYLKRTDLDPMAKGWYDFVCRSLIPTTNRSEVTVERAVLIHSIIIGENINAKAFILDDTYIPQEPPINGEAMVRVREPRARNPRQARQLRQEAHPQQQQPPQEQLQLQVQQQQDFLSNFYTHFDNSMSMIYRRLDNHQEESRRSFEALSTRMNRFDDQLSFFCYSNQMINEQMLSPYQDTTRLMREMEMQGIPVTMANLAIHRQKEEEMRQERMRYDQILQEAAAEKAKEKNKGKARDVDEEDEDTDEEDSNGSEEW
ncbi:hypothetical protein PIB30_025614 [Stylosanthes scabra]|uniref:Putative plant transposon protein domain-containing protein n=1 Tax=Stylosanthes scabra TaxID=79078 RepID=A0ABU6T9S0_9FABA|nr:hypothetical protein [Stylosanthes scabra]